MTACDPYAFREHRLPSGMRVLYQYRPMHFSACRVLIHAGSRQDPPRKRELMHLLEHLAGADMPGIPSSTMGELQRWYKGQRFNVMLGETTLDWSAYDGWAGNDRLCNMLRFMRTLTMTPSLSSQLDKERDIIRRERAKRTSYYDHGFDYARARFMFGKDAAGNQESWGTDAHLDRITIEDVREAHQRWYHPANASLIVIGGIDEDVLLRCAEAEFVTADRPFEPAPKPDSKSFWRTQRRARRLSGDEDPDIIELRTYWYLPPGNGAAVAVATNALSDAFSELLREKLQAEYEIELDNQNSYRDFRKVSMTLHVTAALERRVRSAMRDVMRRMPDEHDFERFRSETMLDNEFVEPDTEKTLAKASSDLEIMRRPVPMAERMANLEALTRDDTRTLLAEHFQPENAYTEIIEM